MVIGRMRNLRPRLSGNGRVADEALSIAEKANGQAEIAVGLVDRIRAERDKATRQRDAFATEVEQLKTLLAEVEEQRDAMARDLIVLAHRRNDLRRMLAASPDQAYRNCLALSDRNEELRREKDARELRIAELEGRAAKPSVIVGGRLP